MNILSISHGNMGLAMAKNLVDVEFNVTDLDLLKEALLIVLLF